MAYPFKCVYSVENICDTEEPIVKILVSVGKRYSKRAVARNKIKRRTKEAYRLNKSIIYDDAQVLTIENKQVKLAFIYISKKEEEYSTIEKGVKKALVAIKTRLTASDDICADSDDKVL